MKCTKLLPPTVPSAPPRAVTVALLKPSNSSSISVSWEPPLSNMQNGIIQEYMVNFCSHKSCSQCSVLISEIRKVIRNMSIKGGEEVGVLGWFSQGACRDNSLPKKKKRAVFKTTPFKTHDWHILCIPIRFCVWAAAVTTRHVFIPTRRWRETCCPQCWQAWTPACSTRWRWQRWPWLVLALAVSQCPSSSVSPQEMKHFQPVCCQRMTYIHHPQRLITLTWWSSNSSALVTFLHSYSELLICQYENVFFN